MSKTCIIVEDQPPAQRVLKKYIADLGSLELKGVFADALSALDFLNQGSIDIIFLDVHLPKLSGIDFLKILSPRPKVILTTAFSEYALQGYEYDVVDYLLKPFSFERFVKAVNKAMAIPSNNNLSHDSDTPSLNTDIGVKHTFVKSGSEYINVVFKDILFIKSDGDYTSVHLKGARHLVAHPLRYWIGILPDHSFGQVHKSYIVNVNQIKKVAAGQISIGEHMIPIGRTYKEGFFERFLKE